MKRLIFLALVVAGCTNAQVYETPTREHDTVLCKGGRGDTLQLCCSTWNEAENHLYRCFTANGQCSECYDWCSDKNENDIPIKSLP